MQRSRSPFIALAVTAMIGRSCSGDLADLAHRLHAVHLRHHDVHQHDVDVGVGLDEADRVAAVVGRHDHHVVFFQHGGQREDVAHVVVDDQRALAGEQLVGLVHVLQHPAVGFRQARRLEVQHERQLVDEALGRAHQAHPAVLEQAVPFDIVVVDPVLVVVDDHRQAAVRRPRDLLRKRGRVDACRRSTRSSRRRPWRAPRPPPAVGDVRELQFGPSNDLIDLAQPDSFGAISSTSVTLRCGVHLLHEARRCDRALWIGLARNAHAPPRQARSRASSVEITQTGMWRVAMSFLSRSSTRQPSMSGRKMSSVITAEGLYSRAIARAAAPSDE